MELLERIEGQMEAAKLPLFAITVAAVPCPDTPVIMTLHWHGFVRERLVDDAAASTVRLSAIPSSALQVNEHWRALEELELATLEAAWELGAWDVSRAEAPGCLRPGAESREAIECLQAFGQWPHGPHGETAVVSETPDADGLLEVAARSGWLMWQFRPVCGSVWRDVADDVTLRPDGTREPPCPYLPAPPRRAGVAGLRATARTVVRFGKGHDETRGRILM
jgi:hypothetical protein